MLLDVLTEDPTWFEWSSERLSRCANDNYLAINPIIYAEVSVRFATVEELEEALPPSHFVRLPLPWEGAFLAGKCFLRYRRASGGRRSPLPNFYIGAHAAVAGLTLLTRDAQRHRSYFPTVSIIAPDQAEPWGCASSSAPGEPVLAAGRSSLPLTPAASRRPRCSRARCRGWGEWRGRRWGQAGRRLPQGWTGQASCV